MQLLQPLISYSLSENFNMDTHTHTLARTRTHTHTKTHSNDINSVFRNVYGGNKNESKSCAVEADIARTP